MLFHNSTRQLFKNIIYSNSCHKRAYESSHTNPMTNEGLKCKNNQNKGIVATSRDECCDPKYNSIMSWHQIKWDATMKTGSWCRNFNKGKSQPWM